MRDIAVAHEHYPARGGGEHVAEEIARTFDCDIYTGWANEDALPDPEDVTVHDLFGDGLTGRIIKGDSHWQVLFRDLFYQFHWDHVPELTEFDTIIQSGNNPGWYVPCEEQVIVKYVHSPPRGPYDRFHENGEHLVPKLVGHFARTVYSQTLSYPDVFVANSELVARRCEKYFGVDDEQIEVVYPAVDVESYGPEHAVCDDDYYFTFSRLFPAKRIDEIVHAFSYLEDHRLVIGGSGPERDHLEQIAGDNVEFLGYVSEEEKRQRLAECKAFIFNAVNEDFGICPIEAFASGTPVIGVVDGYTRYQVRDGENGILFDRGVPSLYQAVREFERDGVAWDADRIQAFAKQYSTERFRDEIRAIVARAREDAKIVPKHRLKEWDSREVAIAEEVRS